MVVKKPEKQGDYFESAHPTTKKMYDEAKFTYPKNADERALELKMDKIRTYDGKYDFKSEVTRLCRYMDDDGREWVDTEEVITGRSSIGNMQEYWSRNNYSHDEPDINKMASLQNGEQIVVTGDFIKHVKRAFELPWEDFKSDKDGIRTEIMSRAINGNVNRLTLRVEGSDLPHSYAGSYKKMWNMWFNYSWDELSDYCTKGYKVGDVASIEKIINKLTPDQKAKIKASIKA